MAPFDPYAALALQDLVSSSRSNGLIPLESQIRILQQLQQQEPVLMNSQSLATASMIRQNGLLFQEAYRLSLSLLSSDMNSLNSVSQSAEENHLAAFSVSSSHLDSNKTNGQQRYQISDSVLQQALDHTNCLQDKVFVKTRTASQQSMPMLFSQEQQNEGPQDKAAKHESSLKACENEVARVLVTELPQLQTVAPSTAISSPVETSVAAKKANEFLEKAKEHSFPSTFDGRFQLLLKFKAAHGHCRVPVSAAKNQSLTSSSPMIASLGYWVQRLRRAYKTFHSSAVIKEENLASIVGPNSLTRDRVDQLEAIGFEWKIMNESTPWEKRYEELLYFHREHGHANVPRGYKPNPQLSEWVHTQRILYRKRSPIIFDTERQTKLESLGLLWYTAPERKKPRQCTPWEDRFAELVAFKAKFGHLHVPRRGEYEALARWVHSTRTQYRRKAKMLFENDRIARMQAIGFSWNVPPRKVAASKSVIRKERQGVQNELVAACCRRTSWEDRFAQLAAYKEKYGHVNVSRCDPENEHLARWMHSQRTQYRRKAKMLWQRDRIRRMEELGFEWKVKRQTCKVSRNARSSESTSSETVSLSSDDDDGHEMEMRK